MHLVRYPALRVLLSVLYGICAAYYVGLVWSFTQLAASGSPREAVSYWVSAVAVSMLLGYTTVRHVLWVQKYYYFRKLRRQLETLMQEELLIERHYRGVSILVMRTDTEDTFLVAGNGQEYFIGLDDMKGFRRHTVTVHLPGGGLHDRVTERRVEVKYRQACKNLAQCTR